MIGRRPRPSRRTRARSAGGVGASDLERTLTHAEALGARYDPPGEFGALYVNASRADALRELDRRAKRLGVERSDLGECRSSLRIPRQKQTLDRCQRPASASSTSKSVASICGAYSASTLR